MEYYLLTLYCEKNNLNCKMNIIKYDELEIHITD